MIQSPSTLVSWVSEENAGIVEKRLNIKRPAKIVIFQRKCRRNFISVVPKQILEKGWIYAFRSETSDRRFQKYQTLEFCINYYCLIANPIIPFSPVSQQASVHIQKAGVISFILIFKRDNGRFQIESFR